MARDRGRTEQSLRRKPWRREPRRIILIVSEGKETEPNYFKGLRGAWKLTTAEVEVVGEGATPRPVVERAIALRDERNRKAKQGFGVRYDAVWAVFDRDKHTDFGAATAIAKKAGIKTAHSVPCIELWYLLHFTYTTRAFANYDELKPELKKRLPDYEKSKDYCAELLPKLDDAFRNAEQLRRFGIDNGTKSPATDVDLLVRTLKAIADS